MPITEDDAGLVEGLRALLHQYRASWVAAEVDPERFASAASDPTQEAELLLEALARSLGLLPEMLLEANEVLGNLDPEPIGAVFGETQVSFTERQRLETLAEAARVLRAPVNELLDGLDSDD